MRDVAERRAEPCGLRHALAGGVAAALLLASGTGADAGDILKGSKRASPVATAMSQAQIAAQQAAAASAQSMDSLKKAMAAIQAAHAAQARALANPTPLVNPLAPDTPLLAPADGLSSGIANQASPGLVPDSGIPSALAGTTPTAGSATYTVPSSWSNITGLAQTTSGGGTTVTISQDSAQAIANWQSFNVGANTTVEFAQTDSSGTAHSTWTTLNRVLDPGANPSLILGHIEAPGAVYVINRNGIIFGSGAQVDTHALVASTLDVGDSTFTQAQRDSFFLQNGIGSEATNSSGGLEQDFSLAAPTGSQSTAGGNIVVDAGASLTTSVVSPDAPGYVYLFGANVSNAGAISSPEGEVAMAAAQAITLTPGAYFNPYESFNSQANAYKGRDRTGGALFRGTGLFVNALGSQATSYTVSQYLSGTGDVSNSGLIDTRQGTTILAGDTIEMGGVISADTAIQRNSSVFLDAVSSVTVTGTFSIQPYDDGSTLPLISSLESSGSNVQTFVPPTVEISAYDVTMGSGALIDAPGATVTLTGQGANTNTSNFYLTPYSNVGGDTINPDSTDSRLTFVPELVTMQSGAVIDVSGLQDVQLPASYNIVSFQPRGNEFADDPLQRNGPLYGQTIYIDIRDSGKNADGTTWIGTPLANAGGYVGLVGQNIYQLLTTGGSVSIATDTILASEKPGISDVDLAKGSVINVGGGYVQFLPGLVPTTDLLGADGHLYPISEASPDIQYVGIFGGYTITDAKWGVTQTFVDSIGGQTEIYEPGYIEGHDAGGISIATIAPTLAGSFLFGAPEGQLQLQNGIAPSGTRTISPSLYTFGGTYQAQTLLTVPAQASANDLSPGNELPSQGYLALFTPLSVVIGAPSAGGALTTIVNTASGVSAPAYGSLSPYQVEVSAATLSAYNLTGLGILANDLTLAPGSGLTLAPGGHLDIQTAGAIDIEGTVTAHDGQVAMATNPFSLSDSAGFVGTAAPGQALPGSADIVVGSAGAVDASGLWINDYGAATATMGGPGYINGGGISLTTDYGTQPGEMTTGNVVIDGVLDVSSGGYVDQKGTQLLASSGLPAGSGGSITLETYAGGTLYLSNAIFYYPSSSGPFATVQLDGALIGYGFSGGGTLTIGDPNTIVIGASGSAANSTYLSTALFQDGFGSYALISTLPELGVYQSGVPQPVINANDQITVAAGTTLGLVQRNYSYAATYLGLASGSDLYAYAKANDLIVTLPESQRQVVNLSLAATYQLLDSGSSIVTDPGARISLSGAGANGVDSAALILGAVIDPGGQLSIEAADIWLGPQANIDLAGVFVPNALYPQASSYAVSGTLLAGGSASFDTSNFYASSFNRDATGYVVGEAGAVIDVSGAAGSISTTLNRGASEPAWSDGGSITVNTGTFLWDGSFAAAAGNPQGNAGTFALGGARMLVVQDEITSPATSKWWATVNQAAPTLAQIGYLTQNISLDGSGAGPTLFGARGIDIASVDDLGTFGTVYLAGGTTANNGPLGFFTAPTATNPGGTEYPDVLAFAGNIAWPPAGSGQPLDRLYLEGYGFYAEAGTADAFSALQGSGAADGQSPGTSVTLDAAYVQLTQVPFCTTVSCTFAPAPNAAQSLAAGGATLTVDAQTIDIQSANLYNIGQADFTSAGDIAFQPSALTLAVVDFSASTNPSQAGAPSGQLASGGNLTLTARRIYPDSDYSFAIAAHGTVTFDACTAANGCTPSSSAPVTVGDVPLSAGGALAVSAPIIIQDGNLFAPSGSIALAGGTQVTLGAGSITSVSLEGATIPYGETEDGTNWFYELDSVPLGAPPAKSIALQGPGVTVSGGAIIDLSGGGDLQAIEFVPGTGGSRDVLSSVTNPDPGQAVYAILPGQSQAAAAYDASFAIGLGDQQPLAGQQIYLSGGNGVAAGYYTLYPAHYATLPGALRVVVEGSAYANPGLAGTTQPDGTTMIAGYFAQQNLGLRSSGSEVFAVQTPAVWRQYSEIDGSSANAYFATQAASAGAVASALPMDGGQLILNASRTLVLDATALAQPATGGRGGELDISAAEIDLVGNATTEPVPSGFIAVNVGQLDQSGFDTILVGGTSTDSGAGTVLTPTAQDVLVDTDGTVFAAPQIILLAQAATTPQSLLAGLGSPQYKFNAPAAGTGNIAVLSGSVIASTGGVDTGAAATYVVGNSLTKTPQSYASYLAGVLGGTLDGTGTTIGGVSITNALDNLGTMEAYGATLLPSLLLVSNNAQTSVTRQGIYDTGPVAVDVTGAGSINLGVSGAGTVSVASGARIGSAGTQAVVVNAPTIAIADGGAVAATTIGLATGSFAFTAKASSALPDPPPAGMLITPTLARQLGSATNLDLSALTGGICFGNCFPGGAAATPTLAVQNLRLDTPWLAGTGANATIDAGATVTLLNGGSGEPLAQQTYANTALVIDAGEIVFGGGNQNIAGFANVTLTGASEILAKGAGTLTFGGDANPVAATLATPLFEIGAGTSGSAEAGTQFVVTTLGDFTLASSSGRPPALSGDLGGNLQITAAAISDTGTIRALSGTIGLTATHGDLSLGGGAAIEAGGYAEAMFDETEYSPGGTVVLMANAGSVVTAAGSVIDVSEPAGGLAGGGEVAIDAPMGQAQLAGAIALGGATDAKGNPTGFGGILAINTGGSFALDGLASLVNGLAGTIDVTTGTGSLVLGPGHTLAAQNVTLAANDTSSGNGAVTIEGTIDADGLTAVAVDGAAQAGGSISLYGYNAVTLGSSARLYAEAGSGVKDQAGGTVSLGVGDCDCGELGGGGGLSNLIGINLMSGSQIDVRGGISAGGVSGGTVLLRAPIYASGSSAGDVAVGTIGSTIAGAGSVTVEAYRVFSTTDGSGFDGIIDPAGTFASNGKHLDGIWCASSPCGPASSDIIAIDVDGVRYVTPNAIPITAGTNTITPDANQTDASGVFLPGNLTLSVIAQSGSNITVSITGFSATPLDTAHIDFYTEVLADFVESPISSAAASRLDNPANFAGSLGAGVFAIQPGVELDNPSGTANNGNITVASTWNLAAGAASNLLAGGSRFDCSGSGSCTIIGPSAACGTHDTCSLACPAGAQCFVTAAELASINDTTQANLVSSIQFTYRYGLEPGELTLRALGNVDANASISDGFFQFQNYEDPTYQSALYTYVNSTVTVPYTYTNSFGTHTVSVDPEHEIIGGIGTYPDNYAYTLNSWAPVPLAPYQAGANSVSPTGAQLAAADLFPYQMQVYDALTGDVATATAPGSWSYRIAAGANAASADPNGVGSLATYGDTAGGLAAGQGNVVLAGHASYSQAFGYTNSTFAPATTVDLPTMIRTGTGDIAVTAARDVELVDTDAPGVIYAAGVNAPLLPAPAFVPAPNGVPAIGSTALSAWAGIAATQPGGFLEPQLLDCYSSCAIAGPPTAAAYPILGGNVAVAAGQDIVGVQNVVQTSSFFGHTTTTPYYQFYDPWLYSATQGAAVSGVGAFGYYDYELQPVFPIQTSWWIQFGAFDQGVLSGGGNITIAAGRDLRDFSASLPTTGRVSGGLAAGAAATTQVYGSGNLTVRVGRNLESGSFYEGSGTASIAVGGSVISDWNAVTLVNGVATPVPVYTILAVDSGRIDLTAAGPVTLSGIVNPAELHAQNNEIPTITGSTDLTNSTPLFMDAYGPQSAAAITSLAGSVTVTPTIGALTEYGSAAGSEFASTYPASLDVVALSGNIAMPREFVLANSDGGGFNLLAEGTLDLTGGTTTALPNTGDPNPYIGEGVISAGASLIDEEFNPYEPDNGYDASTSTPRLTHVDDWNDSQIAHLYAVTGDIKGGAQLEINRPAEIEAGQDIVDLNVAIENLRPSDVSTMIAGRDLYFTGTDIGTGIQIAGPGYLDVEAGRNLGPFLPAAYDQYTLSQQGIVSVGDAAEFMELTNVPSRNSQESVYAPVTLPVGNDYQLQAGAEANFIGPYSSEFTGPLAENEQAAVGGSNQSYVATTGARNLYLPTTGANVIALFGVANGVDYQAVETTYIDPANAASVGQNYAGALQAFLAGLGIDTTSSAAAWNAFLTLSPNLQHVFVDQVYFDELAVAGEPGSGAYEQYQRGYAMVNTLFPSSYGYTENQLGGGTNGANTLVFAGNLDMLHSTIQTEFGGDVMLMGPGGNILVGSTAVEKNASLKLNNLGILTLDGGSVDTFTDQSVEVNDSRVFTEQGGDILMWTSNGNLDAGKGAKTTASFPPLDVTFDDNDFETIDLGGLVTGAGIGVLATSQFATASDVVLIAPRGTVDAGEAGIRSSGNLSIAAAHVVNASNIQVGGTTSGVPAAPAVNAGALAAAASTAAAPQASKIADLANNPAQQQLPSIITVEVLGYGGGDQPDSGQGDQTGEQKKKQ